jgi:hypothetical protein
VADFRAETASPDTAIDVSVGLAVSAAVSLLKVEPLVVERIRGFVHGDLSILIIETGGQQGQREFPDVMVDVLADREIVARHSSREIRMAGWGTPPF